MMKTYEDRRIEDFQKKIENAQITASETASSWRDRCIQIMAALGFDYGDLDENIPEEYQNMKTKKLEAEISRLEDEKWRLRTDLSIEKHYNESQESSIKRLEVEVEYWRQKNLELQSNYREMMYERDHAISRANYLDKSENYEPERW